MNSGIGERLKMARRMAAMTQEEVAAAVGVSKMAISKYENEKMVPGSDVLIALAEALSHLSSTFCAGRWRLLFSPCTEDGKRCKGARKR